MSENNLPRLPLAVAKTVIGLAGLPRDSDGKTYLSVPIAIVESLISQAISDDRDTGPIDAEAVAVHITRVIESQGTYTDEELKAFVKQYVKLTVLTLQARGARILPPISEDDYAEASRAGHETFMSVLKDKGLIL